MRLWSIIKPAFWDHEDIAAGARKHLFNFRRIWRMSVILTAGVALAPVVFMTLVDYNVSQRAIEAEINYQTSRLVSNTRRSIAFFLAERQSALNFIDKDNTYPALGNPQRLAALLENLKKGFGGFTDIGVIDHTGFQHAYVGPYQLTGINYSDQDWFKEVLGSGMHVSEVFLGVRQQPHLVVAVKHDLAGGNFYILRASIDTQKFNDLLAEVEVGGKGDIFLVDHEGVLQTLGASAVALAILYAVTVTVSDRFGGVHFLSPLETVAFVGIGIVLGLMGSWLALRQVLKEIAL